jgi:nitronate monooxygenase
LNKTQPITTRLTEMLGISYPIIMAPMFLVSDTRMVIEATRAGITGAIPALNYRTDREMRDAIALLKEEALGPIGINLIANKSNFRLKEQLKACLELRVDYVITSLGNPQEIINQCHDNDILVFCDVVDDQFGAKVSKAGADALIAVNRDAGGHAGKQASKVLISSLRKITDIPIISAGGVATGAQLLEKIEEGACGISMGSPFIATVESPVSEEYKKACVQYSAEDIVMTTKLSGTPCTVINTPYVQKAGTKQNAIEAFLNKNKRLKKLAKGLTFYRGMKSLQKAAFSTTYRTVWCAGPSIQYVSEIRPIKTVVEQMVQEYHSVVETSQET